MIPISFSLPRVLSRWTSSSNTDDSPNPLEDTDNTDTSSTRIALPPPQTHDIESSSEKRTRALKHLIKLNHANHAALCSSGRENEIPGLLTASYIHGANGEELNELYETVSEKLPLEPWVDSPGEVALEDWRDYLGCREYQRAYVNYFEDELVRLGYDWKEVVREYLFSGRAPLFHSIFANCQYKCMLNRTWVCQANWIDGQPLLHLACALEFSSRELAMEALGLTATCYSDEHKYLDDPGYTDREASYRSTSLEDILHRVRSDTRFGASGGNGDDDLKSVFRDHETALLDHWNAWQIEEETSPVAQFHSMQTLATALLLSSQSQSQSQSQSYFYVLATTHAIRTILPLTPTRFQIPLFRQWWLFALAVYVAGGRPRVDCERLATVDLKGRDWRWVLDKVVRGPHAGDSHVVQTVRVLREAESLWDEPESVWLGAGVLFVEGLAGNPV